MSTLLEVNSVYLLLAKMRDASATLAVEGFSAALNQMHLAARKTITMTKVVR